MGQVVNRTGPPTFRVEVLQTIKSVRREDPDQEASSPSKLTALPCRITVVLPPESRSLRSGETYMLAARNDARRDVYEAIAGRGIALVPDGERGAAVVQRYRRAYQNQIPYEPS